MDKLVLHCCGCLTEVEAYLTDGLEIYPHRKDLKDLKFWKCPKCENYVGCHSKTENKTKPLGCIATPEIKKGRQEIHKILDPLWKSKRIDRKEVYAEISNELGWQYHTAKIRTIEEAREVYKIILRIKKRLT